MLPRARVPDTPAVSGRQSTSGLKLEGPRAIPERKTERCDQSAGLNLVVKIPK